MSTLYQLSYWANAAIISNLDFMTFLWPQRLPTASEVTPGLRTELSDLINPCYHASLTSKWLHDLNGTHVRTYGQTSSIYLRGFAAGKKEVCWFGPCSVRLIDGIEQVLQKLGLIRTSIKQLRLRRHCLQLPHEHGARDMVIRLLNFLLVNQFY